MTGSHFLMALSICVLNNCAVHSQETIDSLNVGHLSLALIRSKKDEIALEAKIKAKNLDVQGAFLVANPGGFIKEKPQYYSYPEIGVDYIFIIIGEVTAEKGNETNTTCGKKIQGIMIKGNKVILTPKTLSGNITCSHYKLDEKVFWDLAH